jgi:hypothetical protein
MAQRSVGCCNATFLKFNLVASEHIAQHPVPRTVNLKPASSKREGAPLSRITSSVGLGRIERAILAIVDVEDEREQTYAARDLVLEIFRRERLYPDWWPTEAQHFAVIRALHSLAHKFPERFVLTGGKGRVPLWLNVRSGASVAEEDARI